MAKKPIIRLKPESKALLLEIAKATPEAPYNLANRHSEPAKELIKNDLLLFNEQLAKGDSVPTLLNEVGAAKAKSYRGESEDSKPRGPLPKPDDFTVVDDVPIPENSRTRTVQPIYPFETMAVGASFFIAPTETGPNPAKSKQSTISTYNRKAEEAFEKAREAGDAEANAEGAQPRKFLIREYTQEGVTGARVWRTQ